MYMPRAALGRVPLRDARYLPNSITRSVAATSGLERLYVFFSTGAYRSEDSCNGLMQNCGG